MRRPINCWAYPILRLDLVEIILAPLLGLAVVFLWAESLTIVTMSFRSIWHVGITVLVHHDFDQIWRMCALVHDVQFHPIL